MNFLFHLIHGLDVSVYRFLNVFAGNRLIDLLASYEEGDNLFKGGLFLAMYAYVWFQAGPRRRSGEERLSRFSLGRCLRSRLPEPLPTSPHIVFARCTIRRYRITPIPFQFPSTWWNGARSQAILRRTLWRSHLGLCA